MLPSPIRSFGDDTPTEEKNRTEKGVLYLVATPIGNLADLSERAVKVLHDADFIAAEDTRNSARMLSVLGIQNTLVSYHEHNKAECGPKIADRVAAGETCALITDAGTPGISDPGADLVALCAERSIPVTSVPGCCAGITALVLSGLPTARFCFEGFLPVKGSERRERIDALSREERTCVLHEAPHRLQKTLEDLNAALNPSRRLSICREMTKKNEDVLRTTLEGALAYYTANEPRGEYVLVLEGTADRPASAQPDLTLGIPERVSAYMAQGLSKNDAIKKVAKEEGLPKNEVYQQVLDLK